MKKQTNMADVAFVAAAAGAAAAGAVIAIYEVLKSEKGQAGIAKAKTGVVSTAAKVKAKLPTKAAADECDCDLGLEDEVVECAECAPVEA